MDDLERQMLDTWAELARRQAEADQRARAAHAPQQSSIPAEARHAAERAKRQRLKAELRAELDAPLHRPLLTAAERWAIHKTERDRLHSRGWTARQ